MKKTLIALALVLVAGFAAYTLWFSPTPAPDVRFTTLTGQSTSLAALKGKVVLVNFWATSCPGCIEEMPQMRQMLQQYGPAGFTVVAVAMNYDPPNYVQSFAQKNRLPFLVTMDTQGQIAKAFGDIQLTPSTFLIDRSGNIVKRYVGVMNFNEIRQLIEHNTRA
ncbi:MAG: TlpA family protein disulfide reductase [Paludibacterium sp.]|uniref:peroxiredoxin family protein n=1 Tax=Paludibacterium sp. TaxID=1917523 RepID=UPI002600B87D|nr:TlpA disulfide reductase family protein [Paludibacterium sp.]MBV8046002.1 TlpA family protein disulfide reductase [Paludibacterium sp.]MBV8648571.1 TlpA family protein disulfide reductase [Paludibacterium sp.]